MLRLLRKIPLNYQHFPCAPRKSARHEAQQADTVCGLPDTVMLAIHDRCHHWPNQRIYKDETMSALLADWKIHCDTIVKCAEAIFRTANVPITEQGFKDPKFLALTLLARTVSNLKGTMVLLDANRIVEARTIARCCLENLYWTVALAEKGEAFVNEMREDEHNHRKAIGQAIFESEASLDADVEARLRAFMRNANKSNLGKDTLKPKAVAQIREDFSRTYMFYSQLSSDSGHPSLTALSRYAVPDPVNGYGFDTEPVVRPEQVIETYEYLSMACMGVCVGVNQIIGGTEGGKLLNAVAERHDVLSNASKKDQDAAA
jgi:hypothetical protein